MGQVTGITDPVIVSISLTGAGCSNVVVYIITYTVNIYISSGVTMITDPVIVSIFLPGVGCPNAVVYITTDTVII